MSESIQKFPTANFSADEPSGQVGFLAAVISTCFGFLYLLGLVVNLVASGSTHSADPRVQFFSAIIAILWNPVLVILFVVGVPLIKAF